MKKHIQQLITASMFAALCCVATMIIQIPSPLKGYINLGDCAVLLAGWMLSPGYGFAAAGIGSALADIFSGYALYAPVTFAVKGLMALFAQLCFNKFRGRTSALFSRYASGAIAEAVMIFGYFAFEACMYGIVPATANMPANGIQAVAGLLIGTQLILILQKIHQRKATD